MPIASHFFLDGEAAFMDGAPLDQNPYKNPYMADDEAAKEWRAGWLTASNTVRSIEALGDLGGWTVGIITLVADHDRGRLSVRPRKGRAVRAA